MQSEADKCPECGRLGLSKIHPDSAIKARRCFFCQWEQEVTEEMKRESNNERIRP